MMILPFVPVLYRPVNCVFRRFSVPGVFFSFLTIDNPNLRYPAYSFWMMILDKSGFIKTHCCSNMVIAVSLLKSSPFWNGKYRK